MFDPMAAPVITIGAFNPDEPPNPTVIPMVIIWAYVFSFSILDDFLDIEKRMLPKPFSNLPLNRSFVTITVIKCQEVASKCNTNDY